MLDRVRPLLLRALRVPPDPATQGERVRIFRASERYYRYGLLKWSLKQLSALIGIAFGLAFVRALPDAVPATAMMWIRIAEGLAIAGFLVQLPVTFAMLRLDFELRWYIVGERSLRIRAGLMNVREQTMTFANIQNMSIRQGPLQRLLGISDLEVQTAGGGGGEGGPHGAPQVGARMHVGTFRGVDDAHAIRDTLRERVRHFRDAGLGDPDDAPPPAAPLAPALEAAREVLAAARALRTTRAAP